MAAEPIKTLSLDDDVEICGVKVKARDLASAYLTINGVRVMPQINVVVDDKVVVTEQSCSYCAGVMCHFIGKLGVWCNSYGDHFPVSDEDWERGCGNAWFGG